MYYTFPKPLYREVLQSHGKRWQATRNEDIIDQLMLDYGDTERTAVHEAGHAVLAHVLGLGVGHVTCRPELKTGLVGQATHYKASHAVKQGWIRTLQSAHTADILGAMAGIEAEYEICGPRVAPFRSDGDDGDLRNIAAIFLSGECRWSVADLDRVAPRLRRFARQLVRRHRDKIITLAAHLLAKRDLDETEVADILKGHPRPVLVEGR